MLFAALIDDRVAEILLVVDVVVVAVVSLKQRQQHCCCCVYVVCKPRAQSCAFTVSQRKISAATFAHWLDSLAEQRAQRFCKAYALSLSSVVHR